MRTLVDTLSAIAFDLDGTLIDTAPDLAAAANAMLEALEMRRLPADRFPALIGQGVDQLVRHALEESAGDSLTDPVRTAAARVLFGHFYAEHLFERSRVYPGVLEGVRGFLGAGLKLGCITNKAADFALPLLEAAGLQPYLDFTLCPERAANRKPSPALLLAACARLRIAPCALLYVGDAATDVLAARAAGCPVVAVRYGYDSARAGSGADAVVGRLAEVLQLPERPPGTLQPFKMPTEVQA